MICEMCGKDGARVRKINRTYGKGQKMFIIENIPLVTCPNCGESYFTADTFHEIERLKLHHQNLAKKREIEVIGFG